MKKSLVLLLVALLCAAFAAVALTGCDGEEAEYEPEVNGEAAVTFPAIRVGTLSTDDLLPLWAANYEGLLEAAGLDVEIITFQSGQESLAAITAGEVDALMTDMVVATLLYESQIPVRAVTTMAGAPAGIAVGPDTGITSLEELANVPVAISTPTVIEYTVDTALRNAGVGADEVEFEIIPALSTRYQMLMEGNVPAAGLPWTLMALAEQEGATVLLDREQASGITSTVLVFSQEFIDGSAASGETVSPEASQAAIAAILEQWDVAVEKINANPDDYRELLIEGANLPEPLRETFPIAYYLPTQLPDRGHWDAVLDWMREHDYLTVDVSFEDLVFQP